MEEKKKTIKKDKSNILNSYYQVFSTKNVFDITNLQSMLPPILDVLERLKII